LVTAPTHFLDGVREEIEKNYKVTYAYGASYSQLKEVVSEVDAWIVDPGANYKIDFNLLSMSKKLKILVSPSTGSDHVDLNYLNNESITFDCLKGKEHIIKEIHASAEFSFALLIAMIRKLVPAAKYASDGFWREKEEELRGIELNSKTIGIIGYGRIGKKMARYCNAFGANILIYDPFQEKDQDWITQVDTMDELLEVSDINTVHVHLDESTRNLIGRREFRLMKNSSYFLNTARGGVVDEEALIDALENNEIFSAAVDVISGEQEEGIASHPLIEYSNKSKRLLVTPHIAGATVDSQYKAFRFALDKVDDFFNL
jgi:phosphoglycerate dehydrogenase-like enzyme